MFLCSVEGNSQYVVSAKLKEGEMVAAGNVKRNIIIKWHDKWEVLKSEKVIRFV
jgi:hypothetical protein